jgi:putative DNA primase/helicase
MTHSNALSPEHFVELTQGSGLSLEAIDSRQFQTIRRGDLDKLTHLGFPTYQRKTGLLIPIWGVDGEIVNYQLKPDIPRRNSKQKELKYETCGGRSMRLDIPPRCKQWQKDPSKPAWFIEGIKKAERAVDDDLFVVGLTGVYGFLGKSAEGGVAELADFDAIAIKGRTCYVCFDSDSATNKNVWKAMNRIAGILRRKGATVYFVHIPPGHDGAKQGYDDYRVNGGTVESLVTKATTDPGAMIEDAFDEALAYDYTDLGNARRFVDECGAEIRWVSAWKQWLAWDGKRWVVDELGGKPALIKVGDFLERLKEEALLIEDKEQRAKAYKHAMSSQSGSSINAMMSLVKGMVAVVPEDLDQDGWLVNCMNGIIDLRSGALLPHDPLKLMTKMIPANYDPVAECPNWVRFNRSVFKESRDLCRYIWKAMGYSLTSNLKEKCFFFLYGTGENGKSVFTDLVSYIYGDYWKNVPVETFMSKKFESSGSSEIARLKGARVVTATEAEDGKRLDEALIKRLTGGDVLTAALKYGQYFDFEFVAKVWMSGNHRPKIGMDKATWRRVVLVPFEVTFAPEQQDKELRAKLRAEADGIFTWMVKGCLKWQQEGLERPKEITEAVEGYRAEMDVIGHFLEDRTEANGLSEITGSAFYTAYKDWCKATSEYCLTSTAFGRKLTERGIVKGRRASGIYYPGLRLVSGSDISYDD